MPHFRPVPSLTIDMANDPDTYMTRQLQSATVALNFKMYSKSGKDITRYNAQRAYRPGVHSFTYISVKI